MVGASSGEDNGPSWCRRLQREVATDREKRIQNVNGQGDPLGPSAVSLRGMFQNLQSEPLQ